MFLKKPIQQLPLQYAMLFALLVLSVVKFFFLDPVDVLSGVSFLLLVFSAAFLQLVMWRSKLSELRRYYPAMLLLLLLLPFVEVSDWKPLLCVFLLVAFYCPILLSIYGKDYRVNSGVFFGMVCGLLSSLYFPAILLFPLVFVLLANHRLLTFRSLLLPLVGFGLFVCYLWTGCFLFGYSFEEVVSAIVRIPVGFEWGGWHMWQVLALGSMLLLYVCSVSHMLRSLYSRNILLRKKCGLLFFLSLCFLLMTVFTSPSPTPLYAFAAILCMLLSEEEAYLKKYVFYNLMFAVLWVAGIASLCL